MHEISVASGILDRALSAAQEHGADRIDEMTLEIGRATHVNPDQLAFVLETIADGTSAEGADVTADVVEPVAACDCGWRDTPAELELAVGFAPDIQCPECGDRTELVAGTECRLASIEVPDAEEQRSKRTEQSS